MLVDDSGIPPQIVDAMGREIFEGDIVVMLNNGMKVGKVIKIHHWHTHPISIREGEWQQSKWCLKLNGVEKMLPLWVLSDFKPIGVDQDSFRQRF